MAHDDTGAAGQAPECQSCPICAGLAALREARPEAVEHLVKAGAELLFDVIGTAYERTSVILTTNLPFENWTEVLGSERLTGAALDRLTHRCHILETKGESYRLQDAKRRRRTG